MISLPFARRWKNNSSKSSSTGQFDQFDWPMAIETHIQCADQCFMMT